MPPQHDFEPAQEAGGRKIVTELPEAGLQNSFPIVFWNSKLTYYLKSFVCSSFYFSSSQKESNL